MAMNTGDKIRSGCQTLVAGGCSFTLGPSSWACCAADHMGWDLINLAAGGAGNDYICRSVIETLESQDLDPAHTLIMVMWSGIGRKDFAVSGEYWYWLDDYVCKSQMPECDHGYWAHSGGLSGWMEHVRARDVFGAYYRSSDPVVMCKDTLHNIVTLEHYLKDRGYAYWFMSYHNYWRADQQSITTGEYTLGWFARDLEMYQRMQFDRWLFLDDQKDCIFEFCRDRNLLGRDGWHPSPEGHKTWFHQVIQPMISNNEEMI